MTDAIQKALLPCPFCGGAAVLEMAIPCHSGAWVQCVECDARSCSFKGKDADDSDAIAIAAWNSRAATTPADEGELSGGLTKWHLDNWPDAAFREHIPAVRATLAECFTALERVTRERDALRGLEASWENTRHALATLRNDFGDMRLRAESAEAKLAEARKVIEPFARLADNYANAGPSDAVFAKGSVFVSDIRAARRWIEETKS